MGHITTLACPRTTFVDRYAPEVSAHDAVYDKVDAGVERDE